MRLIDADKLKESITNEYLRGKKSLMQVIDAQLTAYDLDKVAEQLQEIKEEDACKNISCALCKYTAECMAGEMGEKVAIDRAIEMVKGGGVE